MTLSGLAAPLSRARIARVRQIGYAGQKLDPSDPTYPTLCLVQHDNSQPETPTSIGYLYRRNNEFHYSSPTPDEPELLFEFNPALSAAGKNADWYLPLIAPDGSVVLIWHGNYIHEFGGSPQDARHNPIVYPAGDFANPVVVNITGSDKPTAPVNHLGADFDPTSGALVFAEYTRPVHTSGHIWRVTAPYTSPEDWSIVHTEDVDEDDTSTGAIEHFHGMQFDPYSGTWFVTSGDLGKQRKLLTSPDGVTWTLTRNDHNALRMLNAIPTEDYLWWGTDNVKLNEENWLYRVPRGEGNVPDWDAIEAHKQLQAGQAVYSTHLITEPDGLLFLPRVERYPDYGDAVSLQFYSFDLDEVIELDRLPPLPTLSILAVGFRCEGKGVYPNANTEVPVLVGFGAYANEMQVLDNDDENPINTLAIHITEELMTDTRLPGLPFITGLPRRRRGAGGENPPPDDDSEAPESIPNLVLWLDASDAATVTESSGAVSQWSDKSQSGFHATQASSNRQPTLSADVLNGKPVIQFDGSDFLTLSGASAIARNVAGFTAFVVASSSASGATQRILHINTNHTSNEARFTLYKSSSNAGGVATRRLDAHDAAVAALPDLTSSHAIIAGVADYMSGTVHGYFNGGSEASDTLTGTGSTSDTASGQVRIGGVTSTTNPDGEVFLTGDVAEVIAYQRALSTEERETVEAYLADKWGITLA